MRYRRLLSLLPFIALVFAFSLAPAPAAARDLPEQTPAPAELASWSDAARDFLRAGENMRALTLCRKILNAVEASSRDEATIVSLAMGDLFFRHMRYEESYEFHAHAARLLMQQARDADSAKKILAAGNLYHQQGMSAAALQFYALVGDWAGKDLLQERAIGLAAAKSALGNAVGAAAALRHSMKRHGDPQGQLGFQLAWVQFQAKRWRQALEGFLRVAREHPKTQWAGASLYYAATASLSRNEPGQAKGLLEQFLTDYPENDLSDEAKLMMGKIAEPSS